MGFTNFSSLSPSLFRTPGLSTLLSPVHTLAAFFMPTHSVGFAQRQAPQPPAAHFLLAQQPAVGADRPVPVVKRAQTAAARQPALRLKVMRVLESGESGTTGASRFRAGRMAISGRMADVCAELDRIAQKEG